MRLLHIDDERNILNLAREELKKTFPDIQFTSALGGEIGLRTVYEEKPDIVLLDIRMPPPDGLEVLRRIKSTDPQTVVIMFTAYSEYQENFAFWHADDYVIKCADLSELIERLKFFIRNNRTKNRIYQDNFPFPISYNLIALRSKISSKEILDTLFNLSECILKYFVSILAAENRNNQRNIKNILNSYKYSNLTLGKWHEMMMTLSRICLDKDAQLYVPEIRSFFHQVSKKPNENITSLERIISLRNKLHQRPFTERQAETVASEVKQRLWNILDGCIFFKDYILQLVESAIPDSKNNTLFYHMKYLMGSHPEFLMTVTTESKIYPYRKVFLKRMDGPDILVLDPYLIFDFDSVTGRVLATA